MNVIVTDYEKRPGHDLSQVESEFAELLKIATGCRSCLEIGSLYGGSAERLAQAMPAGSRMVCVDLGYEALKPEWKTLPALLHRLSSLRERDVTLVLGSSQDAKVHEAVTALAPFDLVFIDGGHNYDAVSSDWQMYGPLGRIVAFHDLASSAEVARLFGELRPQYRHTAFIDGNNAGIGVIWRG